MFGIFRRKPSAPVLVRVVNSLAPLPGWVDFYFDDIAEDDVDIVMDDARRAGRLIGIADIGSGKTTVGLEWSQVKFWFIVKNIQDRPEDSPAPDLTNVSFFRR